MNPLLAAVDTATAPGYVEGNRLPVPQSVKSAHFLYLTQALTDCEEAVATLSTAVRQVVVDKGIRPAEIVALRPVDLENPFAASAAIGTLLARLAKGAVNPRHFRAWI